MRLAGLILALLATAALTGCTSPVDASGSFAAWASGQQYVVSVDARAEPGADGMSAHLVVDGAIDRQQLRELAAGARDRADELGTPAARINLIVGNAWGFSVDAEGTNAAVIGALRDQPSFVAATLEYEPLGDEQAEHGLHGVVGSQAALRGANEALAAAILDNGGSVDDLPIEAGTADGAFSIVGVGVEQPLAAIELWQAISGRVVLTGARAALAPDGSEELDVSVGSPADEAAAKAIGAGFDKVELTVTAL